MNTKLISAFLILSVGTCFGQIGWGWGDPRDPWVDEERAAGEVTTDIPCDQPVCVESCPSAAPPRYCPDNASACNSGCACMLECQSPSYVCYQTKFCISRRRYLNKKHTPAVY